jgi:starvation-inducible DNA-binding protein
MSIKGVPMSSVAPLPAPANLATPTELEKSPRNELVDALNSILADVFSLYVKTKNFHWHVSGPHFRDYHRLFEEQATQVLSISDDIAERVRKIGGMTLRSIGDIQRTRTLADNDHAFVTPPAMLTELREDNLALIASLRSAHELASGARDVATTSLIENWIDAAETRAWFLFEAGRQ